MSSENDSKTGRTSGSVVDGHDVRTSNESKIETSDLEIDEANRRTKVTPSPVRRKKRMAELAIKVGSVSPDPTHYQDGDILAVFNDRTIRCVHAQHICHVKNAGGGKGGHRADAHVAKDWFESTHQYRFERVSRTEIKRVTLADMTEVLIDGTPKLVDGKMQHMDVERYIQQRLAHEGHKIFGAAGAEVWYGGRTDVSDAKLTTVWSAIETKTAFREVNFPHWPAGTADLRSHLFVPVDDFDDATATRMVAAEIDNTDPENPVTLRKRDQHIDWRDEIPARDHAAIEDKTVTVDLRESLSPLTRATAVKTRPTRTLQLLGR